MAVGRLFSARAAAQTSAFPFAAAAGCSAAFSAAALTAASAVVVPTSA